MKGSWMVIALALGLAAPCAAESRAERILSDFQASLKRLGAKADRWMDDLVARIKAPPKTTVEDDVKDAGRSLEKAADQAAKKIKKLTR